MSTNRLHITQATDRARLTETAENNCRTADDKINLIDSDDILIFYYLIPSKKLGITTTTTGVICFINIANITNNVAALQSLCTIIHNKFLKISAMLD